MTRKHLMISAVTLLLVISIGCATTPTPEQPTQGVAQYVANFSYTPAAGETTNSAGVTFAVGNASYKPVGQMLWFTYPQFENLDKAIREDLSELLVAKGFSVCDPFDSYDLIPYSDKKATDLYLIPTIELSVITPEIIYSFEDIKVEVAGKINVELREIVTRELMWAKNIPLTKIEVPFMSGTIGVVRWKRPEDGRNLGNKKIEKYIESVELGEDSIDYLAKGIEKQYPDLMATIFELIDPEEMSIIKKQCQELKSEKGY